MSATALTLTLLHPACGARQRQKDQEDITQRLQSVQRNLDEADRNRLKEEDFDMLLSLYKRPLLAAANDLRSRHGLDELVPQQL